jgi:hypothetical protein
LKEYKNYSFLPNVNPRCSQFAVVVFAVFRLHIGDEENIAGSNLNNY